MKTATRAAICLGGLLIYAGCEQTPAEKKHADEAAKEARLKWEKKTLVAAYQQGGHTDPKWDDSVKATLSELARSVSGVTTSNENPGSLVSNTCSAAVESGCDDPLIRYFWVRYCMNQSESKQKFAEAFCQAATALENSSYPSIRKYYGWLRAGEQCTRAYGYGTNIPTDVRALNIWPNMENDLMGALGDKTMPPGEVLDICSLFLANWKGSKDRYPQLYQQIAALVNDDRARTAPLLLLKGEAYIAQAWLQRGGGYANNVSADGWKGYADDLAVARTALTQAWKLDPYDPQIAVQMMSVVLGQSSGRPEMERWFERAMELDPNNYDACDAKLKFIQPAWYGSAQDMLAFGHECVQSDLWGGNVPLILMDAHREIFDYFTPDDKKMTYWSQPEVWTDIKSAFDKFFELNPDQVGWYHNYTWYAYEAGDWDTFNALLPKLGPVNYSYFGGQERFEKMVAMARQQASSSHH